MQSTKNFSIVFAALLAVFLLSSCEETASPVIDPSGSGCQTGLAQIGVGDGFIMFLCGCTGQPAAGTTLNAPASITCHIPAGTEVMFQYIDIHNTHQIINTGGLSFPSGQPIQPGGGDYTTAAQFNSTGTYNFEDAYDTAITGQITVP